MANEHQPAEELSAKGAARRRFTRAGAAASGVLLTLHSQPGMAATACASPSGFLSGTLLSHHNQAQEVCKGRTPGFWKQQHKTFPTGVDREKLFRDIFPVPLSLKSTYGSDECTLQHILVPKQWDFDGMGRHLASAYLNVQMGWSSYQTVQMLVNMWNEWATVGYFTPTAGVKWGSYEITQYLKSTMPL